MRDGQIYAGGAPALPGILPLLAEGLVFQAGGRRLIDIERLRIAAGGTTIVLGPNGAGKSLLLRLLHGLIAPDAGRLAWAGRPADAATRKLQAMVFQRPVLLRRSVAANIDYALKAHGEPRAERAARVAQALEHGGLAGMARQPARTLSGGEQQRLALVRALAVEPAVLFLDEPTASLDPAATAAIERLVSEAARNGTKIIMVTHDIGQARRLGDEVVFLHRGRVVEHSDATAFFQDPGSREARAFIAGELVL
ncbi:ATP-binding cassette domain-containing protein [Limibaculum sp. M0105]|uniref:ATP-binding cassette domain-containing protein n=1 Tax=Thermohalobaculum xanthum TaxID=2753746 RepID=A0A8J7M679_9RHOB|nr:ATP-binding cassette domain-containing protein [Thermohalobaculum xanthum]MBK0399199.1 ATP-binding cassette domain-containing protein [Thermohalobaculum xanthum]